MKSIEAEIKFSYQEVILRSEKVRNLVLLLSAPLFWLVTIPSWLTLIEGKQQSSLPVTTSMQILGLNLVVITCFALYQWWIRKKFLNRNLIPRYHQTFSIVAEQLIVAFIILDSSYIWGAQTAAISPILMASMTMVGLTVLCHHPTLTMTAAFVSIVAHTSIYSYFFYQQDLAPFSNMKDMGPAGQFLRCLLLFTNGVLFSFIADYQKKSSFTFARKVVGEVQANLMLERYLGQEIKEDILAPRQEAVVKKELCIMFIDLRGFTTFSESRIPQDVKHLLSRYYDYVLAKIEKHGGLVKHFMGDGAMVVFGYRHQEDCKSKATRCAREIVADLPQFSQGTEHNLTLGIGIHYGAVVVGDIGNANRSEFAVIGNTVNLASRIESLTKELQVPILLSEEAIAENEREQFQFIKEVAVRGQTSTVRLYTPLI